MICKPRVKYHVVTRTLSRIIEHQPQRAYEGFMQVVGDALRFQQPLKREPYRIQVAINALAEDTDWADGAPKVGVCDAERFR